MMKKEFDKVINRIVKALGSGASYVSGEEIMASALKTAIAAGREDVKTG